MDSPGPSRYPGRMIARRAHIARLEALLARHPIVAVLGARQVGKTTLAREVARRCKRPVTWLDLESLADQTRLAEPLAALRDLRGLVVVDEVQRRPDLLPVVRELAARPRRPARFLLLGKPSPDLLRRGAEALGDRAAWHELGGFSLAEVGAEELERLWLRGGLPRSFLAQAHAASAAWRRDYLAAFLERDLPQLGVGVPLASLRAFWAALARQSGQLWRPKAMARSLNASESAVARWLELSATTGIVRALPALRAAGAAGAAGAARKASPVRVHVADSGLLHTLLGVETGRQLEASPLRDASWRAFALAAIVDRLGAHAAECWHAAAPGGGAVDLVVVRGERRLGFVLAPGEPPADPAPWREAPAALDLARLFVVHAGERRGTLAARIAALPLARVPADLAPLAE